MILVNLTESKKMLKYSLSRNIVLLLITLNIISEAKSSFTPFPNDWPDDGLLVFPENGKKLILTAITNSKSSIDLCLYRLEDNDIIENLTSAQKRGVNVRLILQKPDLYPEPFSVSKNKVVTNILQQEGIDVHYLPDHKYILTHYKFVIFDKTYALIQTLNYDSDSFHNSRNFGLGIHDKSQVSTLQQIFDNDYKDNTSKNDEMVSSFWENSKLILGPVNQRQFIYNFIQSAKSSLHIYQQDITDPDIARVLCSLAREGKRIQVLMSPAPFGSTDLNRVNHILINHAGGECRFLPKNKLYIHAKVIIIDPENEGKLLLGSCNFWSQAVSSQRELGIIEDNTITVKKIYSIFAKDWDVSTTYEEADM